MNQTTVQSSVIQLPTDPTIQELVIQEKIVNDDHDKKPTKIKKPTKKRKTHKESTIQESTDKHGVEDGAEDEIDGKIDEQSSQNTISKQPNYILQYFIFDNTEYDVDIIWEKGKPLFKAADIGKILDIQNIHTSIKNFDEDEKVIRQVHTFDGTQQVAYLTQYGVYRLTLDCDKPIAKHLKKWVFQVTDEINNLKEEHSNKVFLMNETPPNVQSLNGVLQNIHKISSLLSNIDERLQNAETSKQNTTTEIQPFQEGKRHKSNVKRGDKIQRYSPDGKTLIKTYSSIIDATRDPELGPNGCNNAIKNAIENNTIYRRYRWAYLTRDKPDNEFQKIEPTYEDAIQVNTGFVAMLNLRKDKIVAVFANQKAAAEDRKFINGAPISRAIRQETQSGGHYFKLWHECSPDLKNKYLEKNNLPEVATSSQMKGIIQIGADGTEKKYANITQVTNQFHIGRKTLFDAIEHEYLLQGFKWKFAK